jgi:hypothetical protein
LTPSLVPARTLALAHSIEFGPLQRANADRMLEPGFAVDLAGRTWIQSGERLLALERDGGHALFDPEKLVHDSPIHGAWLPAFGDADRPWPQRPALAGRTLALVLGRARETRGNALAGFDVGRGAPRLAWLRHDAEHPDDAVLPGRLEFQPGPLIVDGLVLVQVLQWQQDGTSPEAQHVDGRNTRAWLAALDAGTGRVVWKRLLGKGADRRARALERTDPVRATSVATLPLALAGAAPEVVVATEIGAAARVSVRDGRLRDAWRLKRVPHDAAVLPGSGGPWVSTAGRAALAPADADEFVYVLGQDPLKILRVPGLECLLGLDATGLVAVARADERSALARVEIASGARTTSLPFARGADWKGGLLSGGSALVAAGDGLALYDAGLALRAVLPLPGLEDEHHVGVWANGSRVLVAGEGRLWIVRVE